MVVRRRYKNSVLPCEICTSNPATHILDLKLDGKLFEFYRLCDEQKCRTELEELT
jgi:hypothetical protein